MLVVVPLQADDADPGIIAYVQVSTHDIHVVSPDGTGDRVLWAAPRKFFVDPPHDLAWLPDASGFLFTQTYVPLTIRTDLFEYSFATEEVTQLTDLGDDSARGLSLSPDGRQVVFEREEAGGTSSLWPMDRDGSGLRKLMDDAGRPAWGRVPAAPTPDP